MQSVYSKRIALLKGELRKRKMDSLLVTKGVNVSYLSGFMGHDSAVIVTSGRSFFITDSRYIEEANASVKGFDIILTKHSLYEAICDVVTRSRLKRLGFESMDLPYEVFIRLKKLVGKVDLVPVKGAVENLRIVKDPAEVALIKKSIRLTKDVFEGMLPCIKSGMSEKELAARLEIAFLNKGARPSFDIIIAAGPNSSKPHAAPTARKVGRNSFIMADIGCVLRQYHSDMTRMVITGKASSRFRKIYNIVRTAQLIAIEAIRPGVQASRIDEIARGYIRDNGFGKNFGHALGHGVGMEVHELPTISGFSETRLVPGMVFTIEPAIYLPGFGGVRIEDMVLVTDKGCEVLSK